MSKTGIVGGPQPILAKITTINNTPTAGFSIPLQPDTAISMEVRAVARGVNSTARAEFRARNLFGRTAAGVSARDGSANGVQDSVANTFSPPQKPSVSFGSPAVTNVATFLVTGQNGVTIDWDLQISIVRGVG